MVRLELHPKFLRSIGSLSPAEVSRLETALRALQDGFGQPHAHSGLGIRRLHKDLFECRASRRLRVLFYAQKGVLTIMAAMDHDAVEDWLRNL